MEQIIMLLVFALAAAVCLRVFALAGDISDELERKGNAVTAVQNIAESLKINGGDLEKHAEFYGGSIKDGVWKMFYDSEWFPCDEENSEFYAEVSPAESENDFLGKARIFASTADGEIIFEITAAWQEVKA